MSMSIYLPLLFFLTFGYVYYKYYKSCREFNLKNFSSVTNVTCSNIIKFGISVLYFKNEIKIYRKNKNRIKKLFFEQNRSFKDYC